jgi:hypothetical protein
MLIPHFERRPSGAPACFKFRRRHDNECHRYWIG